MSRWSKKVRAAMDDPKVRAGIGQIATYWLIEHIERNQGRAQGGGTVDHKPLKPVFGERWVTSRPRDGSAVRVKRETRIVNGKTRTRTLYLVRQEGFRTTSGGQPLRDTGFLVGNINGDGVKRANGLGIVIRGPRYGLYQDRGFKTKGPNYIPLTKKGRRGHATGANPNKEGLKRGKDFTMAWKGVTVPSRPFLLPTRADLRMLGKSIHMSLRAILKGR
jgi:hypothetical protein